MKSEGTRRFPAGLSFAWFYSVRAKLVVVISVLIVLISLFIYCFFPARQERQAIGAAAEKANSIAAMMAYNISPALVSDDRPTVCDVVISAKHNPDVDYVMVLDDSARVIATFDSTRARLLNYVEADFAEKVSGDHLTYQTVAPIASHARYLGRIYVGLSLRSLNAEIAASRRVIAWVSLLIVAFGIVFVVILSTLITRPLVTMVEAAEKISHGHWKERARIGSKDEVGQLAVAFNGMVGNLELAYDDLRRSEKNYRDLFESNPHPMWVYDLETLKFFDMNDAAIERYGYSREEFLQMTIHDIIMENPRHDMEQLLTRQGNMYRSTGWRHRKKDGTIIDVEMSSHPLPLRSGRKARLVLAGDITERLRSETLLRESEERYRDLFENSSDLIQSVGGDCKFQFVNRAWLETLGYSQEEVAQLHVFDIVRKDELAGFKAVFRDVINGKRFDRLQVVFTAKDGRDVVVEGSLSAKVESGEVVSTRGIFRDITERKKGEQAIRESKERYRVLSEATFEGISVTEKGIIVDLNVQYANMLGYEREELIGKPVIELIHPDDHALVDRQKKRNTSEAYEHRLVRKDRTPIFVEVHAQAYVYHGRTTRMSAVRDITARKFAEEELLFEKSRFEQLFENAPIGIVLADRNDNVIHVNRHFHTMFGYSLEEVTGRPLYATVVPERLKTEGNLLLARVLQGESVHVETVRARKGGEEFHVTLYVVPISIRGETIGFFGMYVDISERKKAEETQKILMDELESTNKELNDFAYIVSHDLKAPLRAIGSLVSWLSSDFGDKLGAEGNEMMKILLGRTTRMHDLIDGVLKYSRIGRTKEEAEQIPLDDLVPGIVELLAPPEHIEVKIQRPLPIIMGEKTRVQQVFQNLLSNAVKFMDKPEGRIEVGCERENGHWKFSVADNGPGIEERHFEKVFQIFQTLSPRDDFENTGIGLTIVKKIVETHGGRVWLESKVSEGTTFFFTFPARAISKPRRDNGNEIG